MNQSQEQQDVPSTLGTRQYHVCVEHNCSDCPLESKVIPESCKYAILHSLEEGLPFGERGRQTGKTTTLVELALGLEKYGFNVYYISESSQQAHRIKQCIKQPTKIMFCSISSALTLMRGMPSGVVVIDEVSPEHISRFKNEILYPGGHQLVGHLWSKW